VKNFASVKVKRCFAQSFEIYFKSRSVAISVFEGLSKHFLWLSMVKKASFGILAPELQRTTHTDIQ